MRTRLAVIAILLAGFGAAGSAHASVARADCGAGYVSASLPWGHKCLRAGEFCKIGNKAYIRYGYVCPATGHLRSAE